MGAELFVKNSSTLQMDQHKSIFKHFFNILCADAKNMFC